MSRSPGRSANMRFPTIMLRIGGYLSIRLSRNQGCGYKHKLLCCVVDRVASYLRSFSKAGKGGYLSRSWRASAFAFALNLRTTVTLASPWNTHNYSCQFM
jgi:hypothetical protein